MDYLHARTYWKRMDKPLPQKRRHSHAKTESAKGAEMRLDFIWKTI